MAKSTPSLSELEKSITKKYGDIAISASTLLERRGKIIPTTLSLDIALKGGIVDGSVMTVSGVTGSGKTTLILHILANAQKLGKKVFYCDVENRLQPELVATIEGLDAENLTIIRSTKGNFLTAEKVLNIIEQIVTTEPESVVVLDSVAMLCPEVNQAVEHGEKKKMLSIPSMLYDFFRKMSQCLPAMGSSLILVTHLQANPTPYGGPAEVGGNAMKFQANYRIMCMSTTEVPKDGEKTGRESTFRIYKSALGPGCGEGKFYITYGKGYDRYKDIANLAEGLGMITKAGAWYSFEDPVSKETVKCQGMDAVVENLRSNPNTCKVFEESIRELAIPKVKATK